MNTICKNMSYKTTEGKIHTIEDNGQQNFDEATNISLSLYPLSIYVPIYTQHTHTYVYKVMKNAIKEDSELIEFFVFLIPKIYWIDMNILQAPRNV